MSDAVGIHAHATKKLGRRPAKDAPALKFGEHLLATPAHPITDAAPNLSWPMDDNDRFGVCVPAGLDHALQCITSQLGVSRANWTQQQIFDYYRTQNPTFDPATDAGDQGMDVQTFLEYLVKQKVIVAFAKVNPTSEIEVKAATYLGLAIVTGEGLDEAQQAQQVWDYVAGSPQWGGHCTCWVGYLGTPDQDVCVTWGQTLPMTQSFIIHQVEEAWFVLTEDLIAHPGFRAGFDLSSFAAAYTELTGSPFPVVVPPDPVPPAPGPSPAPTPTPGPDYPPAPVPASGSTLRQWLSAVLHWAYSVWRVFRSR